MTMMISTPKSLITQTPSSACRRMPQEGCIAVGCHHTYCPDSRPGDSVYPLRQDTHQLHQTDPTATGVEKSTGFYKWQHASVSWIQASCQRAA